MASRNGPPVQLDFVPRMQKLSFCLSALVNVGVLSFGVVLLLLPPTVIRIVFQEAHNLEVKPLDLTLCRMTGGVFIALALSCMMLAVPFYHEWSDLSSVSVDKSRTATGMHLIVGLLMVVCGLLDDRVGESGSRQSLRLLGIGFCILIASCLNLMLSFWPVLRDGEGEPRVEDDGELRTTVENETERSSQPRYQASNSQLEINETDDDMEPLLATSMENVARSLEGDVMDYDRASYRLLEDPPIDASRLASDEGEEQQEQHLVTEPTSRIRGTRRLLALAKPEVIYLYMGCAALLIRLPFSLSIPHFVSTTLGCLSRSDFSGAHTEIVLLFILGSIDACLDFWCVFLFGYANQRIVRGVRIDTFGSILKQEVAFFDKTTSGELASRLNSDCGQMAGGKRWVI